MTVLGSDLLDLVDPRLKKYIFSKFEDDADALTARFEELLKFLYLSSKYSELKGYFIPVTKEVDELWHALILQTAYYQKLCFALPGACMVHHESMSFSDYKVNISKKELIDEILRWISLYVKNFGDIPEGRLKYWYFIKVVKQTLNLSIDELNRHARSNNGS